MRLFGSVTNFVQNVNEYGWLGRVLDVQVESPDINFASLHEDTVPRSPAQNLSYGIPVRVLSYGIPARICWLHP